MHFDKSQINYFIRFNQVSSLISCQTIMKKGAKLSTLRTNEKIFYGKNGKPETVLLDYKVYTEMLELIEDSKCVKIIQERDKEPNIDEKDFSRKFGLD